MKKFIPFLAVLTVLFASCNKESIPVVQFEQTFYTIYAHSNVNITVSLSQAATERIVVPVLFSGEAVKGTDYMVSCDCAVFEPGENTAVITVKDLALTADKSISLTLGTSKGYSVGTKYVTVISLDEQESIIYSFKTGEAVMLDKYIISLSLTGATSGKDFKATEALSIPLIAGGEGASAITLGNVTIPAGESSGTAVVSLLVNSFSGNTVAQVRVDPEATRFIPGDTPDLLLHVRGLQLPVDLLGTWVFDSVYDLEELELWFMEGDDDPDELPTHNDGFTLTFAREGDYVWLTPGGTGDFNKFFRHAKVILSTPVNPCAGAITLGSYTTEEANMFISEVAETYQQNTYYKLDTANLAFSSSTEQLGPARIVFRITPDGDLCTEFREYTNADAFGANWWDSAKFDPDMFGFASKFKKQ